MFTSEQMTGSGQMNMLDQINSTEERIEALRSLPHKFHSDPGHGWLEVEYQDLLNLRIAGDISGYSYRDGSKVYLEEDMDAGTYINALFGEYGKRTPEQSEQATNWIELMQNYDTNGQSFIRSLNHYR